MKKQILYLFGLLLLSIVTNENIYAQGCGTMSMDSFRRTLHPQMGSLDDFEIWLQQKITQRSHLRAQGDTVYRIPIIFHIVSNGDSLGAGENISLAQINSQISALNQYYGNTGLGTATNPSYNNTSIQFCPALEDPDGNELSESGVHRINTASLSWGQVDWSKSETITIVKPNTIWDPNRYLNIWTVLFDASSNLNGYGTYPDASGLLGFPPQYIGTATDDGVVMNHNAVGNAVGTNTNRYQGTTLAHEIGHFLGLNHVWGVNGSCSVDDYCADTPDQNHPLYPSESPDSCCSALDPKDNIMDYCGQHRVGFSNDQITRMYTVLTHSPRRKELRSSMVLQIPLFHADSIETCVGTPVTFTDTSNGCIDNYSWEFGFSAIPLTAEGPGPHEVYYTASGNKTVTLYTFLGISGKDTLEKVDYITVYDLPVVNISGPSNVVENDTDIVFSVNPVSGASYQWEVPSDVTITNGQSTFSITVDWGRSCGYVKVTETSVNDCHGTDAYFVAVDADTSQVDYSFTIYNTDTPGIGTNIFRTVLVDDQQRVWAGSGYEAGLYLKTDSGWMADPDTWVDDLTIRTFTKDAFGNLWMAGSKNGVTATKGGIYKWTGVGAWQYFNYQDADLMSRWINKLAFTNSGQLWVAHAQSLLGGTTIEEGGVGLFDENGNNGDGDELHYNNDLGEESRLVHSMTISGNRIFIGTDRACDSLCNSNPIYLESMVAEFDAGGNLVQKWDKNNSNILQGFDIVRAMVIDKEDALWIGMKYGGVAKLDTPTWVVYDYTNSVFPAGARVNYDAMRVDDNNNLWVGTNNGLVRFYSDSGQVFSELISTLDGLPSNNIRGIDFDEEKAVWLATDGGVVKMTQPKCLASFITTPTFCEMEFTECSRAIYPDSIVSWHWDFGDPLSGNNTSTDVNPTHLFSDTGTFTVTFIIETEFDCKDTLLQDIVVPEKKFRTDTVCSGEQTSFFTESIENIVQYTWDFGNGYTSGLLNPSFTFDTSGFHNVQLKWSDGNTCVDSVTQQILVNTLPEATVGPYSTICPGGLATLNASGGGTYSWSPATGLSNSLISNPSASPTETTTYIVTIIDENGCLDEAGTTIMVSSSTYAQIFDANSEDGSISDTINVCKGDSARLSATSAGYFETFFWEPDYNISSTVGASVFAWPDSTTTYQVVINGDCGVDSATVTLKIPPSEPGSIYGLIQDIYCAEDTDIPLTATFSGGVFTGPGVSDSFFNPITAGFGGPYAILYTRYDSFGCQVTDTFWIDAIYETLDSPAGLLADKLTPSSARLNWDTAEYAHHFEIRGRALTVTSWTYLNVPAGSPNYKEVFGLSNNISYEWQIRAFCDASESLASTWSRLDTFTAKCYAPDSTWTDPVTSSAARLAWTGVTGAVGYEIKGKRVGSGSWTTLMVGNVNQKDVFGLSAGTDYEWTIRTWCDALGNKKSDFTPLSNFTTSTFSRIGKEEPHLPGLQKPSLMVHPNPADLTVSISVESLLGENYFLEIFDLTGRVIYQREVLNVAGNQSFIKVENWRSGIYIIQITGHQSLHDKLVIQ